MKDTDQSGSGFAKPADSQIENIPDLIQGRSEMKQAAWWAMLALVSGLAQAESESDPLLESVTSTASWNCAGTDPATERHGPALHNARKLSADNHR